LDSWNCLMIWIISRRLEDFLLPFRVLFKPSPVLN
jgi:hypothetical protein